MKDLAKIQAKEQKQLARLQKEQGKSNHSWYFSGLLVCLILLVILDSFATSCSNVLQSAIVNEFFVVGKGMTFQEGLSALSLMTSPLTLLSILATLMLVLSDKVGRKPMLLTSAIGMVAGMLWVFFAPNVNFYVIGAAMITFFVSFDMHQLYIVEVAPAGKRATWQAISQFFGQMAVGIVGVMRLLNTNDGQLAWRNIYLFPAIVGVVVTILLVVFVRESDVFLTQRIAYLKTPIAERNAAAEGKKKKNASSGGLGKAFGYIFKAKQMRWVFISLLLFRFAIPAFATYYESIMTSNNMATNSVSVALIFMAIACGIARLTAGFVSDKLGRKKASTFYGIATIVALIAFIFGARANLHPVLVGLLCGASTGCYWTVGDQIALMMNESAPTAIRGSVTAAAGLVQVVIAIAAMVFAGIMIQFVDLSLFCVIYGTIVLAIAMFCLVFKAEETNGVSLGEHDNV